MSDNEIQSVQCLGMPSIKFSIRYWDRLLHSADNALRSSGTHVGGGRQAEIFWPSMSHTCSIGFESDENVGHCMQDIYSDWRHLFMMFAWRRRALSFINTNSAPILPRNKHTCCSRMMSRYTWPVYIFSEPSTIPPQTSNPALSKGCRSTMFFWRSWVPGILHIKV